MKWIVKFLRRKPIETSGVKCSSPASLSGKKISVIRAKRFRCLASTHMVQHYYAYHVNSVQQAVSMLCLGGYMFGGGSMVGGLHSWGKLHAFLHT